MSLPRLLRLRVPFAAMIAAAALVMFISGRLRAAPASAVKSVSYSTASSGRALKWLSTKTSQGDGAVQAAASEPVRPGEGANQVRRADGDAWTDVFGDPSARLVAVPAARPGSSSSEQSTVVPPLGEAAPKLPLEAPQTLPSAPNAVAPPKEGGIEQQLQVAAAPTGEQCPDPRTVLVPLSKKDILESVKPKPGDFPQWCSAGKESFVPRSWATSTFHFTASALCHKPVYFEDLQLERYGHTWGPWLQPFVSGGHFFLSVPALPYAMGLFPPNECVYTLGYYRPGSCAPYMLDALPLSVRGALYEAGVWTGGAFVVP